MTGLVHRKSAVPELNAAIGSYREVERLTSCCLDNILTVHFTIKNDLNAF